MCVCVYVCVCISLRSLNVKRSWKKKILSEKFREV